MAWHYKLCEVSNKIIFVHNCFMFIKNEQNAKMNNDVTAEYIMKDVERLRKPMQQVANFILKHMMETADIS